MEGHPRDRLERRLSLTDATFIVVASVIGAGIFFTPGRVAELLPHPAWIFAAWVSGALLSLAGALANAELGTMFPRAGGNYVFLREAFHPIAGFLVGWLTFLIVYAGTIAALSSAFGEGLVSQMGWDESLSLPTAIAVTLLVSVLNYIGVRWGALANNVTSVIKVVALLAFVVIGPLVGSGDLGRLAGVGSVGAFSWAAFGLAMSPILFTYLGWNASLYVASEIRDPSRNIPRSLFQGLALCAGIYLLVNGVYLYALPIGELSGVTDAGQASAAALFGSYGGALVATFVLLSVLGTLNATVLVGPRIAYAMALDGLFFGGAEKVHGVYGTPAVAIGVQAVVSIGLLLLLGNFPSALDFTTFAILLATTADIAALYRLRWRDPDRPRPYRAWGYPVVPALYGMANAAIAAALLWARPFECLVGLSMLLAGLPFYWLLSKRKGGGNAPG